MIICEHGPQSIVWMGTCILITNITVPLVQLDKDFILNKNFLKKFSGSSESFNSIGMTSYL